MTCCTRQRCYSEDSIETPWSWVVLGAGFGLFALFSVIFTPAIYYLTFYEVFNSNKTVTSWIGSISVACMMGVGPVSSLLVNRFGCRVVMITGILTTTLGLMLSMFATSVYTMYLTLGVLMGLGLGNLYSPTTAMISLYFDVHRTLALGLAAAGIGVGMLAFPPITRALMHHYGWRGAFLMLGGIFLHTLPLSLLIQPIDNKSTNKNTFRLKQDKWDIKIFKRKQYIFLCLGYMFITSCMATVFFFLPSYAATLGVDNDSASMLISAIGAASLTGRLFFSFLGQVKRVDVLIVFAVSFFMAGVFTLMSPLFTSFTSLLIFGPAYGFCVAPHTGYVGDQVIAAVGLKNLVSGIGFVMLFAGIGNLCGPPVGGVIVDTTGEYMYSFLFVGAIDLIGAVFLVASWPRWYKECAPACQFSIPEAKGGKEADEEQQEQQSDMLPKQEVEQKKDEDPEV